MIKSILKIDLKTYVINNLNNMPYNLRSRSKKPSPLRQETQVVEERYFNNNIDPNPINMSNMSNSNSYSTTQSNENLFNFGNQSEEWVFDSFQEFSDTQDISEADNNQNQPLYDVDMSSLPQGAGYPWTKLDCTPQPTQTTQNNQFSQTNQDMEPSTNTTNNDYNNDSNWKCMYEWEDIYDGKDWAASYQENPNVEPAFNNDTDNVDNQSYEDEEENNERDWEVNECCKDEYCDEDAETQTTNENTIFDVYNYTDKLELRESLDGTMYLSVRDVFRYVTLGGILTREDFDELSFRIEDYIYGRDYYHNSEKIEVYSNYQNIMNDNDPEIIRVIPYSWRHYRRMARICLNYVKNNYKYISTTFE